MVKYEIMFIVRPDLEKDATAKVVKEFEKVLTSKKANILSSKEIGGQELAYEINGHKTGYYYLINVEASNEAINEFNRLATLSEDVIRHIVIKL
ncbi:MAG: 30S ribosomal protein S6 [Bacilli bacterium]|nr:30S ribosomal protein S6 [Bacilli bacterium]